MNGLLILLVAAIPSYITYLVMRKKHKLQTAEDKRSFYLGKLEKIYLMASDLRDLHRMVNLDILRYITTQRSELPKQGKVIPFQRLKMLITFYAPQLKDQFQKIEDSSTAFGDVIPDALRGGLNSEDFTTLQIRYKELDKLLAQFQEEVSKLSEEFTNNQSKNDKHSK
jgi:hypothetical protein